MECRLSTGHRPPGALPVHGRKRLPSAERERLQLSTQSDVTERLLWPAPQSGQRKAVKTKNVRFCGYGPAPFGALPAHA